MSKTAGKSFGAALLALRILAVRAEDLPTLTLARAHETALRNHPQISVADLKALVARQMTREVRSALFPNVSGNVIAVGTTEDNTRLAAIGGLNNPAIFDRTADGVMISQLITDFGHSVNLTGSAKLRAEAEANNAQATRQQILLGVDSAFFNAQQAQAVTRVARQTVAERQSFLDQVSALATNKLRSELDVSFAQVNVEEAQLLLIKAQNDLQASFAQLANMMGMRQPQGYSLVEEPVPPGMSSNVSLYVEQALSARPDLVSLRNQREASLKYAKAQKEARYPTISAIGAAGVVPIHDPELPDYYAAAGVSLTVPLFAGGYYSARQQEAELQAAAQAETLRDLEDNIIRDVHVTWLNAQNAFERLQVTKRLLDTARQSFALGEARYKNGISSIVEFDQAELNLVQAEIAYASTQYEYLIQRSALNFQIGALH
jgi:outer membrane protein